MRHDGEQSVDDILRSIKQVIGRERVSDTRIHSGATVREQAAHAPEGGAEAVFDLASMSDGSAKQQGGGAVEDDEAPLLETAAQAAMRESLSSLSGIAGAAPAGESSNANALEEMVREMLRPMLKQWLDTNLPEIVERIVQREVRRITGGR